MQCRVCGNLASLKFEAQILRKYTVGYYQCDWCKYLQTETPYWLEESYKSPINKSDTGLISRNLHLAQISGTVYCFFFGGKGKLIDYAGGYGILTRLLRDKGLDAYWMDPYTENIFAGGFEGSAQNGPYKLLTSFECFEHLEKPIDSFNEMLQYSKNILFSTVLQPDELPKPSEWWYYGFEHGQHVGIWNQKSLSFLAEKNGLHYFGMGSVHLITEKKISGFAFKVIVKFARLIWTIFYKKNYKSLTLSDSNKLKSEVLK